MIEYTKRYNDKGEVAVLYSPGFGAGWSTWALGEIAEAITFDSRLVDLVLNDQRDKITEEYINELYGKYCYTGGASDLEIEWLPKGTLFKIDEYDGSESVVTYTDVHWNVA
jgi:hypothetical protein